MTKSPKRTACVRAKSAQKHNLSAGVDDPNPGEVKRLDVTPEEFFKAWSRKDREALIEALIDTLDAEAGDADLEDGGDTEANLAGFEQSSSHQDDAEVDDSDDEPSIGFDERELDEADNPMGEEVNEDGDDNPDNEPNLGFLECFPGLGRSGNVAYTGDREEDGSYVTQAARERYRPFDRYSTNRDGMHVDAERGIAANSRRIRNLSDTQRAVVKPRLSNGVSA